MEDPGGPQQGVEEMGTLWGSGKSASTAQVVRCWALPSPNSEEKQQRSGRDGAFSHPSLVS